jgi:hypothetical protein
MMYQASSLVLVTRLKRQAPSSKGLNFAKENRPFAALSCANRCSVFDSDNALQLLSSRSFYSYIKHKEK